MNGTRRGFISSLFSGAAALTIGGWNRLAGALTGHGAGASLGATPQEASLDATLLRQVAGVVLPDELSAAQKDEAADAFSRWLRGYRAGAERDHGYGFTRLRTTPESPAPGYVADLDDLDGRARSAHGAGFGELTEAQRRALVEEVVNETEPDAGALGGIPGESHVVVALLTHYYTGTAATDLCYGARVQKNTCRDLFSQVDEPGLGGRSEP